MVRLLPPTYNCQTGAITFNTAGGDGSPIIFFAVGITRSSPDSPNGVVEAGLRGDPKPLVIQATQSGRTVSVTFDFAAFCAGRARQAAVETETAFGATVLGNPTLAETVTVDVRGAADQPLRLVVRDVQGRTISERTIERAGAVERPTLTLGRTPGLYLLQITTPSRSRTIKVLRQ